MSYLDESRVKCFTNLSEYQGTQGIEMINEHLKSFAGLPVQNYKAFAGLEDCAAKAWRLESDDPWGEVAVVVRPSVVRRPELSLLDKLKKAFGMSVAEPVVEESFEPENSTLVDNGPVPFASFLKEESVDQVQALIIGVWTEVAGNETAAADIATALAAASAQLPALRALFFGDIIGEESEISWIHQSDMGSLVKALPQLEEFRVRGGEGLSFAGLESPALKSLGVETGGLSKTVVAQILAADLPSLEHLELWFGDDNYGGDTSVEDLKVLLSGSLFPKLTSLGLCNADFTDDIAKAVVESPLLERISTLDLSRGTLTDEGADALLGCDAIKKLKHLNVRHHFVSNEKMAALSAMPIDVNVDDQQEADEDGDDVYRYPEVTE